MILVAVLFVGIYHYFVLQEHIQCLTRNVLHVRHSTLKKNTAYGIQHFRRTHPISDKWHPILSYKNASNKQQIASNTRQELIGIHVLSHTVQERPSFFLHRTVKSI